MRRCAETVGIVFLDNYQSWSHCCGMTNESSLWFFFLFDRRWHLVWGNKLSNKTHPARQEPRSLANCQAFAVVSGEAVLLDTMDPTKSVSNRSIVGYCACHGQVLDAHQFAGISSYGQRKTMTDRRGLLHFTSSGAWICRFVINAVSYMCVLMYWTYDAFLGVPQ